MTIEILHYTPINILDSALTKCWGSECKSGDDMLKRIDRIINKNKHGSIAEHCTVNFDIRGVSRAVLQEIVRHRHSNFTVESSRYTLGRLKLEEPFNALDIERARKYLVYVREDGTHLVDTQSIKALENLRMVITEGISNDLAKYCLPDSFRTSLVWTLNIRSMMNLFELRTDKSALWEFRDLANAMFNALPEDYKFLLQSYIKDNKCLKV